MMRKKIIINASSMILLNSQTLRNQKMMKRFIVSLFDVITNVFQLSTVRISERSIAASEILNKVIYIKCAQVLHIENV